MGRPPRQRFGAISLLWGAGVPKVGALPRAIPERLTCALEKSYGVSMRSPAPASLDTKHGRMRAGEPQAQPIIGAERASMRVEAWFSSAPAQPRRISMAP